VNVLHIFKENRRRIRDGVAGLSERQLFSIPQRFHNNIAWNVGHIVVTQQLLHYENAGLPPYVDAGLVAAMRKGTSPNDWRERPDWRHILGLLVSLPDLFEVDYAAGRFALYNEYRTSAGVVLRDIDDAIAFNDFHEGIHLGIVMAQLKILG